MKKLLVFFLLLFQVSFSQHQLTEVQKLAATCKIWGFLKYYHPNVAAGQFDWDEQLFSILSKVEKSDTKEEFSEVIENWIASLGDVSKIEIIDKHPEENYFYKNLDFSWFTNSSLFSDKLSNMLHFIKENRYQGKHFYIYMKTDAGGKGIREVEMDEPGGIPSLQHEKRPETFTWKEKKYRLLTLFRYWNLIEYFAPNKYLTDKKWNQCLNDILPNIIFAKDELSYNYALLELVTNLNDSHATYYISDHNPNLLLPFYHNFLPVLLNIVEDKFVVTKILNDSLAKKNDLKVGDVILKLNHKTLEDYKNEYRNKIPASNEAYFEKNLLLQLRRLPAKKIDIKFERNGKIKKKSIELYSETFFDDLKKATNGEKYKIIEGNIAYLNLENIYEEDLKIILPLIKNTKGLIIDIRNYPNGVHLELAKFLNASPKEYVKQIYADLKYPGRFIWEKVLLCGEDNLDNYKGKVVVLVNNETISHAEWTTMCLQVSENAIVMGSQTAGADGWNASVKIIFNHFVTTFTGKGVFYPDGKETQRIGIIPDIEVLPTIEGIRNNKDEVLERAIEYINLGF
ncbi:peptidase S41 [Flavobacterium sp. TP390]|uniref:Peptidase S41 n=1 Tax=Flavobacterium profundi TaxID=1774945 RepID=A0A6I4IKU7_9FLAO|nr:S41 family peptidase [Flavobacterium profundi]MVO09099.1 peptidase S41 [Flavobacterium profundi]